VRVQGHPYPQLALEQLADQRDPAGAADQQDRVQLPRPQPGPLHDLPEELHRAEDVRTDQRLQVGTADRDVPGYPREEHRDDRLDVAGERLLGIHHRVAEGGQGGGDRRVGVVQAGQVHARGGGDVAQQQVVEVEPADRVVPARLADQLEAGTGLADHARVEGTAAQVVDADQGTGLDPGLHRVPGRRGDRFDQQPDIVEVGRGRGLDEQVAPVLTPLGRVGQHQVRRPLPLPLGHRVQDPAQQVPGQLVGRHAVLITEPDRHFVAHPTLEVAGLPVRLDHGPAAGRLPDEQYPVIPQEQHGGHGVGPVAQRYALHRPVPPD
jgi:hypothetical protein